jgi:hypothetical protein
MELVMVKKTSLSLGDEPGDAGKFRQINANEQFAPQVSSKGELPDPEVFVRNFTHRAVEVMTGSRDISQIARWVTEDVYNSMKEQVSGRQRQKSLLPPKVQFQATRTFRLSNVRFSEPREGIIEACVLVTGGNRVRAAALRLEGLDRRWRASSFTLL